MSVSDEELVVRSALAAVAQLPPEAMERLGDERTYLLLTAALTVAVHRRFGEPPPSEQIQGYVETLKARFPDGAHLIKPIVTEAVIRYAFGEEEVLEGVSPQDIRAMLFVLPYAIVTELMIDGDELDAFVEQVLEAAKA